MTPAQLADADARFRRGERVWLAWCHHAIPVEIATEPPSVRIAYIVENKPSHEIPLRLRAMQVIDEALLPVDVVEARKAYDEARKAYDEARKAYDEAGKAYGKAWNACDEARNAYDEAWNACDEARNAYDEAVKKNHPQLLALVQRLYPDIPCDERGLRFEEETPQ